MPWREVSVMDERREFIIPGRSETARAARSVRRRLGP